MKLGRLFALAALAVIMLITAFAPAPASAWGYQHRYYHQQSYRQGWYHRRWARWHRHRVWRNHHWVWVR